MTIQKEIKPKTKLYTEKAVKYELELERERILKIIENTWKNKKQTTDKILFMVDFKDALIKEIKGK